MIDGRRKDMHHQEAVQVTELGVDVFLVWHKIVVHGIVVVVAAVVGKVVLDRKVHASHM